MGSILSLDDLTALPEKTGDNKIMSLDDLAMLAPKVEAPKSAPRAESQPETPMSLVDASKSALYNIPSSAGHLVKNIASTVMHPIETGKALYHVGDGLVSKAENAIGISQDENARAEREAAANAMGGFIADRYGSYDKAKNTLAHDPVGLAADLSMVLTGGGTAAARLPGLAGKTGEVVAAAGKLVDPIRAGGKALAGFGTNVVEPALTHTLGMTTGVGGRSIREGTRAGYGGNPAFADALRGVTPQSASVDMVKSAVDRMGRDRGAAYKTNMAGIKADKTQLNFGNINQAVQDAGDMVHFHGVVKSEEAAKVYRDIADKVAEWQSKPPQLINGQSFSPHHTPEGFDALKQAIGDIRMATPPGTLARKVSDSIYNTIKSDINKQAPEYAKAMKDYSGASEKINEVTKTFSLGEKSSTDTALRKLQSITRDNASTNYGARTKLGDELGKYEPDLMPTLAGHTMASAVPRGLSKFSALENGGLAAASGVAAHSLGAGLAAIPMLALASPRLVGEAAHATGRAAAAIEHAAGVVGINGDSVPGLLAIGNQLAKVHQSGALHGGIGPRYDDFGNLKN